jgi:transcription elongation factor Elf1
MSYNNAVYDKRFHKEDCKDPNVTMNLFCQIKDHYGCAQCASCKQRIHIQITTAFFPDEE